MFIRVTGASLVGLLLCASSSCDRGAGEPGASSSVTKSATAATTASSSGSARAPDEGAAIIAMIQTSQRGGIVDRKPEAYMRIWDRAAVIISARAEKADRYDHVLEYAAVQQAAEARSQGKADAKLELGYSQEKIDVKDEQATVTWRLKVTWRDLKSDATGEELTAERYVLRKTAKGWRVVENRFWPLAMTVDGETRSFDEAQWTKLDTAVKWARSARNEVKLLAALHDAWRLKEGLELARKRTTRMPRHADGWIWRARFADRLRQIDETVGAYKQLRTIDPKTPVPGWVQAQLDKDKAAASDGDG